MQTKRSFNEKLYTQIHNVYKKVLMTSFPNYIQYLHCLTYILLYSICTVSLVKIFYFITLNITIHTIIYYKKVLKSVIEYIIQSQKHTKTILYFNCSVSQYKEISKSNEHDLIHKNCLFIEPVYTVFFFNSPALNIICILLGYKYEIQMMVFNKSHPLFQHHATE